MDISQISSLIKNKNQSLNIDYSFDFLNKKSSNIEIKPHKILIEKEINQLNKAHKCHFKYCGMVFKEKGNLKNHLRAHVRLKRLYLFILY